MFAAVPLGSIPAHAGKPSARAHRRTWWGVYPRPCGETGRDPLAFLVVQGLSPPMRGNPARLYCLPRILGSIPAHAGKPADFHVRGLRFRVYPRPCGETSAAQDSGIEVTGLSPPMRGNHRPNWFWVSQPGLSPPMRGNHCGPAACSGGPGLSPPMRGNLIGAPGLGRILGSIPAHAGKPADKARARFRLAVYPRPCGETSSD